MATQPYIQTSFNAGELSPSLGGRIDVDKYYSGGREYLNMIPEKYGPAFRRSGTVHAGPAPSIRNSIFANRLTPFQYNTEQSYVLAVESGTSGNLIRFFKDESVFAVADPGVSITNGTFNSDFSGWTDDSVGTVEWDSGADGVNPRGGFVEFAASEAMYQDVSSWPADANNYAIRFRVMATKVSVESDIYDARMTLTISTDSGSTVLRQVEVGIGYHVIGWTHNSKTTVRFHFENTTANQVIGLDDVALCEDGALEMQHPWDGNDECRKLAHTQSADVLFLGHPDFQPYQLLRLADNVWSLEPYPFENGPWFPDNTSAITMTPAAASGDSIAVTASAATFVASDLGRLIAIDTSGSAWGWGVIVQVTNTTVVQVNIQSVFAGTSGVTKWKLGMWGDQGDRSAYPHNPEPSWPWHPTFHAQRLWWGGSDTKPQTLWSSVTGDFYDFSPYPANGTVAGDNGINRDIDNDQVNAVRWLKSVSRGLLIGTSGGEFVGNGGDPSDAITPTGFKVSRQSSRGSKEYVDAQLVGQSVVFAQATGRKIRSLQYSFESDQYTSGDLTRFADHITEAQPRRESLTTVEATGITGTAYQQEPRAGLWAVLADGSIAYLIVEPEEDVFAWSRFEVGGREAQVQSICVIRQGLRDQVWVSVLRRISGGYYTSVELFWQDFERDESPQGILHRLSALSTTQADNDADARMVDGAVYARGSSLTSVSGLDHLEGEAVVGYYRTMGDILALFSGTVSGGSVTVPTFRAAVIGMAYDTSWWSMPILPAREAAFLFGKHRINRATLQLLRTGRYTIQANGGDAYEVKVGGEDTDLELFTGVDEDVLLNGSTDNFDPWIKITQNDPLPLTVVSMRVEVDVGGI